jgi:hypothetical protein
LHGFCSSPLGDTPIFVPESLGPAPGSRKSECPFLPISRSRPPRLSQKSNPVQGPGRRPKCYGSAFSPSGHSGLFPCILRQSWLPEPTCVPWAKTRNRAVHSLTAVTDCHQSTWANSGRRISESRMNVKKRRFRFRCRHGRRSDLFWLRSFLSIVNPRSYNS